MKKNFIFLLLAVFCFFTVEAKKEITTSDHGETPLRSRVYFSYEVPVNGIAKEGKEFFIDPVNGSFLYAIVDNYPNNFNVSQIKAKIYKADGLQNKFIEEKTYDINSSLYYSYIKYSFYSAGTYTFDIYTSSGEFLGSGSVSVKLKTATTNTSAEAKTSGTSSTNGTSIDPYIKSKVYFSTEVPSYGIAKDVKAFDIKPGGGFVYVIVDNYPNNFNVGSLKMYMYKMINGQYEKRDEVTYTINSNYYFTYFKYTFTDAGQYKFVVYDVNNKYVNTGYVTINWSSN